MRQAARLEGNADAGLEVAVVAGSQGAGYAGVAGKHEADGGVGKLGALLTWNEGCSPALGRGSEIGIPAHADVEG